MLKTILTFALACAAFSARADCLQSWRHDDGRLLTIRESFATGIDGRGFVGSIGEQSYVVVMHAPAAAALSYESPADVPAGDANAPRRQDRQALPPARASQTLAINEGPLAGHWTGEGCRIL